MMSAYTHRNLVKAKNKKNDDFYTQLVDIEQELKHYRKHFNGKVVYCNCDDPKNSNFFHYFSYNFERLGLKKLITTCYKNNQLDLFSREESNTSLKLEYNGDKNNNRVPDIDEIGVTRLKGDGDFRSQECIDILKTADIIVTNPPFSLFREYIQQLIDFNKKFLVLGHQNAISYREIFTHIKNNKLWLGYDNGGTKWFRVKDHYDIKTETRKKIIDGKKYFSMGNIYWFTNLSHEKRNEDLILYKKYSPEEYPKYDNYDAINIDKVVDIPIDYDGYMGVPITFLDKHNIKQFEIIDGIGRYSMLTGPTKETKGTYLTMLNGKPKYARIIIKKN
tara:strand:+ start:174 stop:1172 length:999 start_codon:yes stop_codon:yes gene_type:complete